MATTSTITPKPEAGTGIVPNIFAKPEPSLLIFILSTSNLPSAVTPIVATGFTFDWPDIASPLKLIDTLEPVYPNPSSINVTVSNAPSNVVAVAAAVTPVNLCVVPTPTPVKLITEPPDVADNLIKLELLKTTK